MPQQQFTIEIRVDYNDPEKYAAMRTACRTAAQHLYATAELISDKTKPQIAIFSDDYFEGHKDIDLLDNKIDQGIAALEAAGQDTADGNTGVSDELLDALRDPEKAA